MRCRGHASSGTRSLWRNRAERRADFGALLRGLGFTSAPLVLLAVQAPPIGALRLPIWLLAHIAVIATFAFSAREVLEVPVGTALVCVCTVALGLGGLLRFAAIR